MTYHAVSGALWIGVMWAAATGNLTLAFAGIAVQLVWMAAIVALVVMDR